MAHYSQCDSSKYRGSLRKSRLCQWHRVNKLRSNVQQQRVIFSGFPFESCKLFSCIRELLAMAVRAVQHAMCSYRGAQINISTPHAAPHIYPELPYPLLPLKSNWFYHNGRVQPSAHFELCPIITMPPNVFCKLIGFPLEFPNFYIKPSFQIARFVRY